MGAVDLNGKDIIKPDEGAILHWCEGCNDYHVIPIAEPYHIHWKFNGDYERPTVNDASVKHTMHDGICHYVIVNGIIEYYGDCSHQLSGQKVPLKRF